MKVSYHCPSYKTSEKNIYFKKNPTVPKFSGNKTSVTAQPNNNVQFYQPLKQFLINFKGQSTFKKIDLPSWPRKDIFKHFSSLQNPFFSVTSRSDVTNLLDIAKKKGIPGSHAIMYMIAKTVNDIPEFKCRLKNGEVLQYDRIDMGMVFAKDNGLYNFGSVDYTNDTKQFLNNLKDKVVEAKNRDGLYDGNSTEDNVVYLSCTPWVDFTAVTNPIADYKTDCIPRIIWGKYTKEGQKTTMAISVEAHHAFVDGRHVGLFLEKLQQNFNNADQILPSMGQ